MPGRRLALLVASVFLCGCVNVAPPTRSPAATAFAGPSVAPPASPAMSPGTPEPSPTAGAASFDGPVTARYVDGLPSQLGDAVVHRAGDALDYAASQVDATAFLVTGWVTFLDGVYFCSAFANNRDWLHECPAASFSNTAGASDTVFTGRITFHNVLDGLASGPVVAVVHVHDPRAAQCGDAAAACDRMMVVDRIVWHGDAATAPRPITEAGVSRALVTVQASTDMALYSKDSLSQFCEDALPGALYYTVPSGSDRTPGVIGVELEPDAAAMSRASPVTPGVAGALRESALCGIVDGRTEYRSFVVANAVLIVRTHHGPTTTDQAFLRRLGALLTGSG